MTFVIKHPPMTSARSTSAKPPTPSPKREASRERILDAAAAAFRGRGFAATGVDAVMTAAGLTHGGFYAHFTSKNDLLRAAVQHSARPQGNAMFAAVAHLSGEAFITATIARYLSMAHRDHPETGCPLPTIAAEIPRLDPELTPTVSVPMASLAHLMQRHLPGPPVTARARAQALVALLIGGVVTARALPAAQARAWLASCRGAARSIAGIPDDDGSDDEAAEGDKTLLPGEQP
jgi:TetR/AcrR family transcriptional repressor of nem operon